jgi:ribosomal protein L37AE/L43A
MNTQLPSTKSKAWLFKAFGKEQSYGGHDGYSDIIEEVYKYDSFVPNNKRVSEGDYALIRDQDVLLGLAKISKIETVVGSKRRRKCPKCGTSSLNQRTIKRPLFKCDKCKYEFDNPIASDDVCDLYSAFLENFVDLNGVFGRLELRKYCLKLNEQLAIQQVDFKRFITDLLPKISISKKRQVENILGLSTIIHPPIDVTFEDSYVPFGEDMRQKIMKQISERRGQKEFRSSLIQIYEGKCVVTGCRIIELL